MLKASLNTVQLLWASLGVYARGPGLLWFAPMWGVALLAVLGLTWLGLDASGAFDRITKGADIRVPDVLFLLFVHLLGCSVTLFVASSFVAAIYHRMEGGEAEVRTGLDAAADRLGAIALWAAFAGTIGFLLKPLARSRHAPDAVGRIVFGGGSPAATSLVVPVMMIEGSSPMSSLARSSELYSDTWGGGTVPNFNLAIAYAFFALLAAGAGGGLYYWSESVSLAITVAAIIGLVGVAFLRACETIVSVGLYYYAVGGASDVFPERMLRYAFVREDDRGRWPRTTPPRGGLTSSSSWERARS